MPVYTYRCTSCDNQFEIYHTVKELDDKAWRWCWDCTHPLDLVITAPLLVKAAADVCYDSPIDGSPITSWAARRNDLAKHGCREYDPGMKQDYHQRIKDADAAMEKAVDEHVERSVERMNGAQRGKLWSELTDQGMTADVTRSTYSGS